MWYHKCIWINVMTNFEILFEIDIEGIHWFSLHVINYKHDSRISIAITLQFLAFHVVTTGWFVRKLRGTIVNIISPPRVSFYRREFIFIAASFILLPRDLLYCREFYFTAASFILLPRVLFYCREFCFTTASFIFTTASFIFSAASFILLPRDFTWK